MGAYSARISSNIGIATGAGVGWVCVGCVFWALYLPLAWKLNPAEWIAGAIVGSASAAALFLARSAGAFRFRPSREFWGPTRFWPEAVVKETGLLLGALVGALRAPGSVPGHMIEVPYPGTGSDDASCARRAFIAFGITLTPNSYVVEIDRERGVLFLHQLVGRKVARSDQAFLDLELRRNEPDRAGSTGERGAA